MNSTTTTTPAVAEPTQILLERWHAARSGTGDWIDATQLAGLLGVHVRTVHRWRALGIGPVAHKVGRRRRYRYSDVTTWLRNLDVCADDGEEAS